MIVVRDNVSIVCSYGDLQTKMYLEHISTFPMNYFRHNTITNFNDEFRQNFNWYSHWKRCEYETSGKHEQISIRAINEFIERTIRSYFSYIDLYLLIYCRIQSYYNQSMGAYCHLEQQRPNENENLFASLHVHNVIVFKLVKPKWR